MTAAQRPLLLRWLTLLNLLGLAVLLFSVLWRKVVDTDIWWHLAAGRWIWEHRAIPQVDIFSFTRAGKEWIDLHWLFQLLGYALYSRWEAAGLIYGQMLWVGSAWLLAATIPGFRRAPLLTIGLFAVAIITANAGFLIRPQTLSLFFLALTFAVLWRWRETRSRLLYLLPVTQLLWTNCHSLFVFGLFVIVCFWAEASLFAFRGGRGKTEGRTRFAQISLVLVLSVLAGLVNPYGVRGLIFPYQLFLEVSGRFGEISRYTSEFKPTLAEYMALVHLRGWKALLGLSAISFVCNWRRFRLSLFLVWAGFGYLSWVALRNLVPFSLVAAPIAVLNYGECFSDYAPRVRAVLPGGLRSAGVGLAGLFLLVGQAAFAEYVLTDRYFAKANIAPSGEGIAWSQYPRGAVDFIVQEKIPGPGFNDFEDGGYLIWRLFPEYLVFIDGRQEVSGPEFFGRYLQILKTPERFPELTAEWPLNYALIRHANTGSLPLLSWFLSQPDFALVYLDSLSALFVRRAVRPPDWMAAHEIRITDVAEPALPPLPEKSGRWLEQWGRKISVPGPELQLGRLFNWLHRPNLALVHYAQALEQCPGSADAWIGVGSVLLRQGRNAQALPYLEYGLHLDPESFSGHSVLAAALEPIDPEKALRHHQIAARLRPRDALIRADLAAFYLKLGRPESALKEIRAARRDPSRGQNPILDLRQATIHLALQQPQEAEKYLRRYLSAAPEDIKAHFLLGNLLWQFNQREEARQHFDYCRGHKLQLPPGVAYPDQSPGPP